MSGTERRNAGAGRTVNRSSRWCTIEKRAALHIRDGFRCVYCGRPPRGTGYRTHPTAIAPGLHLDHVTPRSRGGSNDATNVVTACEDCNNHKGSRTLEEWLEDGGPYVRRRLVGVLERLELAILGRLDLRAGKELAGTRAARPLPEYRTPRRVREPAPF